MEKHLLVTVSDQSSALFGVRFVGHFFSKKEEIKITLFYTAPKPAQLWTGERTLERVSERERQLVHQKEKGMEALESARAESVRLGFAPGQVETKFQVGQLSKVSEILQEGERGLYDAVVLGRRGLSWLEEAFDQSVSREALRTETGLPLWLCRRPDHGRKNILVCVDGSDASYRVADHVGFILASEETHEVTVLHVGREGAEEGVEEIFSRSVRQITGSGLPADRVKTVTLKGGNAAKVILKEAERGQYAAVAVGRTGRGQGLLEKIFMGSVSMTLFRELEGAALWLCH